MQLNDDQRNILTSFQEISQINDDYLCVQILQENQWNLDIAVSQFVQGSSDGNSPTQPLATGVLPRHSASNISNRARSGSGSASEAFRRTVPRQPSQPQRAVTRQNDLISWLLGLLFLPLRWLFQVTPVSLNPDRDVQRFIDEYQLMYGDDHPPFHSRSYQSAVATAYRQSKFLLVYLHSPMHQDSDVFCRETLAAPSFRTFADAHLLVWAGNIWHPEAYGLSSQMKVHTYPFVALLVCQSNRTVQIAERIQGTLTADALVSRLNTAVATFTSILTRQRLEAQRREEAQSLREQQDREYQEAAEADRIAQEQRREEERRRAREQEEAQQQAELDEAMERSRQQSRQDRLDKIRTWFQSHPEPTTGGAEVSTVRFQLPQGTKLSRRFNKADTIQVIYDFLRLHFADIAGDGVNPIENFSVATHFPKVELTDMERTIEEVGLHPRGMLYVQDLDA